MTKITIAYAPDAQMTPLTLASMASVLKNANDKNDIEFAIMYSAQRSNDKYLRYFENLRHIRPYKLTLLPINPQIFEDFPCPNWVTTETWFRCLLAELLPNADKVLYLDCDTIVRHPLDDLFATELANNLVGAVEDVSRSKDNAARLNLADNFYFNAGMLLINLQAWRQDNLFARLKNLVMSDQRIANDQDALNKACEGRKLRLSPRFDYMHVWWRKNTPQYDASYAAEFEKAGRNPIIVHFTGVKPNHPDCQNRFAPEYAAYAALVPEYQILQQEIGIKKSGRGRTKLSLTKRLFSIEVSTDRKHLYVNFLGLTLKLKKRA